MAVMLHQHRLPCVARAGVVVVRMPIIILKKGKDYSPLRGACFYGIQEAAASTTKKVKEVLEPEPT
jgi:hypothetical protein